MMAANCGVRFICWAACLPTPYARLVPSGSELQPIPAQEHGTYAPHFARTRFWHVDLVQQQYRTTFPALLIDNVECTYILDEED